MIDRRVPGTGPALQGRPLVDTRSDMQAYYLPRLEVEGELRDRLRRGLNVLLLGPRGSGRTTLLHRLLWESRQAGSDATDARDLVLVRSGLAKTPTAFLQLVVVALLERWTSGPATGEVQPEPRRPAPPGAADLPPWDELASTGAALRLLGQQVADRPRRVVFLVDDLDPDVANQVFGVLRDDIWGVDAQWLLTATPEQLPVLTKPPADAFFDAQILVPDLTRAEASDLVSRRLGRTVEVPDIRWLPRSLLLLAAQVDQDHWEAATTGRARRQTEIAKLGRPASMLAAVMEGLGPVSPSDPRLLDSLGWTASRASQVLGALRDAGFVTYSEAPNGRPGRPARLYQLVSSGGVQG